MPIPTLAEKLQWLKPAPPTPHEIECAAKVRQGDYEIGVQVTNDILDEAMEVFVRSSRSYFGVSGDSMVAIFTANGDLVTPPAAPTCTPLFSLLSSSSSASITRKIPASAKATSGTPTTRSMAASTTPTRLPSCP